MTSTIVIGGGIAGLVTAWELARAGHQVQLLEAAPTLGGALRSHTVAGIELNSGAEAFATASPAVAHLVDDLGLADKVVTPRQAVSWIVNLRGAFPSPANSYLGIPADPLASDVVAVLGAEAAQRAAADATMDPSAGYRPGISLGAYVTARMGSMVRDLLVEPVVGGVHSTDPDLLELDSIAPHLYRTVQREGSLSAAVRSIKASAAARSQGQGGAGSAVAALDPVMDLLPRTLATQISELGGRLSTATQVHGVRRNESGHWVVTSGVGELVADQVVLSTPAPITRALLAAMPEVVAAIPNVEPSPVALVTLVVDDARLDEAPRSNGVLIAARTPGVVAKALTHATAKWAHVRAAAETSAPGQHRHVLRLSYGRSGLPLPTRSVLPELAFNDARRILGIAIDHDDLVAVDTVVWQHTMTQARPGHRTALEEVAGRLAHHPGLAVTGAWIAGTGIAAITSHARRLAQHLAGQGEATGHPISAASAPVAPMPTSTLAADAAPQEQS